jgi:hypothetical protein
MPVQTEEVPHNRNGNECWHSPWFAGIALALAPSYKKDASSKDTEGDVQPNLRLKHVSDGGEDQSVSFNLTKRSSFKLRYCNRLGGACRCCMSALSFRIQPRNPKR